MRKRSQSRIAKDAPILDRIRDIKADVSKSAASLAEQLNGLRTKLTEAGAITEEKPELGAAIQEIEAAVSALSSRVEASETK